MQLAVGVGCGGTGSEAGGTAPTFDASEEAADSSPPLPEAGVDGDVDVVSEPLVDSAKEPDAEAGADLDAAAEAEAEASPPKTSGAFAALTYNVAGLPQGISSSDPAKNTPLISPKLNPFDLVMVQEDFAYHAQLVSQATHPYKTTHKSGSINLGDGVSILSRIELGPDIHVPWKACNGYVDDSNDCLTPKGFVVTTMTLAAGAVVDLYDLHADAGGSNGDMSARSKQMDQLVAYIADHSAGKAVIVAGDTNMHDEDEDQLVKLMTGAGLTDACRALSCPEPYRIDRVLYRGGTAVTLTATQWRVDMTFVDGEGNQLSDHEPVAVDFTWAVP